MSEQIEDRYFIKSSGSINRTYGTTLLITSVVAFLASWVLVLERLALFQNPSHVASCDFGAFVSCTSIMQTWQASLFGFPNPILGLVGFTVTGTIGLLLAVFAHRLSVMPTWFAASLSAGMMFAMSLVGFFWYSAVIDAAKLCPWCMVVWAMVIPMFCATVAYVTLNHSATENLRTEKLNGVRADRVSNVFGWVWASSVIIYALIFASIIIRFRDFIL